MLKMYVDTDADFTLEEAKQLGLGLFLMPYSIDGNQIYPYKDFNSFDYKSFYNILRTGILPKTSALSPLEYQQYIEKEYIEGNDILYVHFSKNMSGTFNALDIALNELKLKYPERKFYEIDTKGITILSRIVSLEIYDLYKKGTPVEEILNWAKLEVDNYCIFFYVDDLKFFAASGRVSGIAAFMGNIIGLHPLLHMNYDGKMEAIDKVRGKRNAFQKLLEYIDKYQDNLQDHRIIIGHTDCENLVLELKELLIDKYGNNLDIETIVVNPTIGSHCGPDAIGVCFHSKGKHRI